VKESITKIAGYVYGFLMETGQARIEDPWGPAYRWEHTLRVANWAWRLAVEEGANYEKCVIAALFHDVSHFVSKDYGQHGVRSAEIAKDFLVEENYPDDVVEDVAYAIKSHVGEANPRTLEAKILQDADTLDRLGCLRILLLGKTAELSNLGNLRKKIQSSIEYFKKVEKGDFGPMWTKRGQAKLKELMKINYSVFSGVLEELESTEAPDVYLDP
jgi:uncharacterized protein